MSALKASGLFTVSASEFFGFSFSIGLGAPIVARLIDYRPLSSFSYGFEASTGRQLVRPYSSASVD